MIQDARRVTPAALKGVAAGARPAHGPLGGEFQWGDPGPGYWKVLLAVNERRLAAIASGEGPFWASPRCSNAARAAEWQQLDAAVAAVRKKLAAKRAGP